MVSDAEALRRVLAGSALLAGRSVNESRLRPSLECDLWISVTTGEKFEAWAEARRLVDQTGRWPVITNEYSVIRAAPPGRENCLDAEKLAAGDAALSEIREIVALKWGPVVVEDSLTFQLNRMRVGDGAAPTREQVLAALPETVSREHLDRWLMDWEERQHPTTGQEDEGRLTWHEVLAKEPLELHFIPAATSGGSLAYMPFWAEDGVPGATPDRLAAIADAWNVRYGAELVAHWGTVLWFAVDDPPQTLEQAWTLATEQGLIAPDTLNSITIRQLARALIARRQWMLHCRP
jgi:hypothetical protein